MKISPHFHIEEFVPPEIYKKYGAKSKWFVRWDMIRLAEFYREYFDAPVIINNWMWDGDFTERGYRVPLTPTGSMYSQHKLGAAFDCNIKGVEPDEIRHTILNNQGLFMRQGLTTLEHEAYSPTWVHSDIRNTGLDTIMIVKPVVFNLMFNGEEICHEEYYEWNEGRYQFIKFK